MSFPIVATYKRIRLSRKLIPNKQKLTVNYMKSQLNENKLMPLHQIQVSTQLKTLFPTTTEIHAHTFDNNGSQYC